MKTFFSDIFPKLQRFSQKLDNLTLLTNQFWVSLDTIQSTKIVYIFRNNNDLLISTNGRVEKAKWEYLGDKALLIDKGSESFLFKHGFFDENILALKIDSSEEYAVFVNESKYNGELNSIDKISHFLRTHYLDNSRGLYSEIPFDRQNIKLVQHYTDKGIVETKQCNDLIGQQAYLSGQLAPDGLYKFPFFGTRFIKDGKIVR